MCVMHTHTSIVCTLPHTHVLTHVRTPAPVKGDQFLEKKKPQQSTSPTIVEQLGLSFAVKPNSKVRVYVCLPLCICVCIMSAVGPILGCQTKSLSLSLSLSRSLSLSLCGCGQVLHMPGWLDSNVEQALGLEDQVVLYTYMHTYIL